MAIQSSLLALVGVLMAAGIACGDSTSSGGGGAGASSAGGQNTGGENNGGTNTGGDNNGGDNTGGVSAGGENTGGDATGGGGGGPNLVNGCDISTAEDMTGMADVNLDPWQLPFQQCVRVDVGAGVTWTGTFSVHPLVGGVTPNVDANSPISNVDLSGPSATVAFDTPGDYPFHCNVHQGAMQGVIYVE